MTLIESNSGYSTIIWSFSGLFLADVVPYELALACLGHDLVLIFDVSRDYEIGAYLGDQ
ncbi:hypothetical protein JY440_11965 [Stenotrophomonas maltophilia]|nr:hypothetical protein [Stenotrophomonas pavanii]MBN4983894.1 hypothetical protein [Stenotrophomonas maltophilia]